MQALSSFAVSFVLEILSFNDGRDVRERFIIALSLVIECVWGIIIIVG